MALAAALSHAVEHIGYCNQCRTFTEEGLCRLCRDQGRDGAQLCIVESPTDMVSIESSTDYRGYYFVLHGHLSPLDGIGPEQLGFEQLQQQLKSPIQEVILATNPTMEGEATASYIATMAHDAAIMVSRLAPGIPLGGELGYVDGLTLNHAFNRRQAL